MTVMTVLEVPDPRLRLVADMIETMYDFNGIGLAATQVGVQKRVLVIDLQEEKDEDDKPIKNPKAYINAEILSVSDEVSTYNEGCLSIPEQYAEVARPARCRVKWLDETGAAHEEDFDGLLSTCMQHEIDHLDGVLFIDHISRLKRDMVLKKLAKQRKLG
jgi:peptide deformylase